jgi:outer membrane biosynthesis protein TonB
MSVEAQRPTAGRAARRRRRDRLVATLGTLSGHALVLLAVLSSWSQAPVAPEPPPMEVTLVTPPPEPVITPPPVADPAPSASPAKAAGPKIPEPPKPAKTRPPPPAPKRIIHDPEPSEVPPRIVPPQPAPPVTEPSVTSAELASATTADTEAAGDAGLGAGGGDGSGNGGGGSGNGGRCDMVRRLQKALGDDASVKAAIARSHRAPGFQGRPLVVWNGDWVRHGDEDGKGLASLRQAIAVEVGFAPKACRTQPMRGLVMLSINDGPRTRVVLGAGAWRWSDLLFAR